MQRFGLTAFFVLAVCMLPASQAVAQSYPGLSTGGSQGGGGQNSHQGTAERQGGGGYGGLTAPRENRNAGVAGRNGQNQNAAAAGQTAAAPDIRPLAAPPIAPLAQSTNNGMSGLDMRQLGQVQTAEDLNLAAMISGAGNGRPVTSFLKPYDTETLAVLNRPQERSNNMWPQELQTVRFIRHQMREIEQIEDPRVRRERMHALRQQVTAMIDVNQARLAAPKDVAKQLGLSDQAIEQTRASLTATNKQLEGALRQLR